MFPVTLLQCLLPNHFQVLREPYDLVNMKILKSQFGHRPAVAHEHEEELEGVSIGPNSVRAGGPGASQVSAEE